MAGWAKRLFGSGKKEKPIGRTRTPGSPTV